VPLAAILSRKRSEAVDRINGLRKVGYVDGGNVAILELR
jgi:hypothetical protein